MPLEPLFAYCMFMAIRQKMFLILGTSQLVLALALGLTFYFMLDRVKDEPQNKRALEKTTNFQRELEHKQENTIHLLEEFTRNPDIMNFLVRGIQDRNIFKQRQTEFEDTIHRYGLTIFEIGNNKGIVRYRFHRPNDYGDDKSSQGIIQAALAGKIVSTLEMGHSGLSLRTTAPLRNTGTMHVGQVVNRRFLKEIVGADKAEIALFDDQKKIADSSQTMEAFLLENETLPKNGERLKFGDHWYYAANVPFETQGLNKLKLHFLILIDETELHQTTSAIWFLAAIIALLTFGGIFIVSFVFANDITQTVKSISTAMLNPEKDEQEILNLNRKDELGEISRSFSEMKKELIDYQKHLEHKVQEQTQELQQNLDEIRTLKDRQDGDYYLTSLLIKPLSKENLQNDRVTIESYVEQKKKFKFRKRESEIGGDLCIVEEIEIDEKNYALFINADAMGKSIQGAGGALVLGTVFKALVARTRNMRSASQKTPERWLKDCYHELQNVFVTFDGSMLISAVIGLLEVNTGTMYYINAEHPWVVLYRDGKASYVENELELRKIGFTASTGEIKIKVFELQPADVIYLGSDGRDDILIPTTQSSERVMNEDDALFLQLIERAEGRIQRLTEEIHSVGELSDDLSLMRIGFRENEDDRNELDPPAEYYPLVREGIKSFRNGDLTATIEIFEKARKVFPQDIILAKELGKVYLKNRDFAKAADLCETYLNSRPYDTDFLFLTSVAFRRARDLDKAIEYGERLRLRNPYNLKNLEHLQAIYKVLGNTERLEAITEQIRKLKNGEEIISV